jgi:hypothetical protein
MLVEKANADAPGDADYLEGCRLAFCERYGFTDWTVEVWVEARLRYWKRPPEPCE